MPVSECPGRGGRGTRRAVFFGPQALEKRRATAASATAARGRVTLFLLVFEIEFQRLPVIVYPSLAVVRSLVLGNFGLGEGDFGAVALGDEGPLQAGRRGAGRPF